MKDAIITTIIFSVLIIITIFRANYGKNENYLGKNQTRAIRGICCIIVIMVHIPGEYSNRIQDLIGSFAFICVTLFFMFSAYGLVVSMQKSENYLQTFWKKRVTALVVPMLIVNCLNVAVNKLSIREIIAIDGFVLMLFLCYILFYSVMKGIKGTLKLKTVLLAVSILAMSVILFLVEKKIPLTVWPVPAMGFALGALIAVNKESVQRLIDFRSAPIVSLGLCIVVGLFYLKCKDIYFLGNYIIRLLLECCAVWLILVISRRIEINGRCIRALGEISYEVYLIHGCIILWLCDKSTGISSNSFIGMVLIITITLAVIVHYLAQFTLEKIPR